MKNRFLGNIEVSPIGMGCMGFSHGYGEIPTEEYSINAIRKAYDFGCTFFDTAESYGAQLYHFGHNEELLGKAVKKFRKKVVIATKLMFDDREVNSDGSIYRTVIRHLKASLERLQTNYVDIYYLHRVNAEIPVETVAIVMDRLIREDLIRGWGLSQVNLSTLEEAQKVSPVSAVQNIYSMVERDCEDEIFPYCLKHNIGVVPFSPVASGLLSGKVTKDTDFSHSDDVRKFVPQLKPENIVANQPLIDLLSEYAEKKHATMAQISLAWILHKYPNAVPIPGSKNQERILENLNAWNIEFTDDEFTELETALDGIDIYGHRGTVEFMGGTMSDWGRKK